MSIAHQYIMSKDSVASMDFAWWEASEAEISLHNARSRRGEHKKPYQDPTRCVSQIVITEKKG